MIDHYADEPGMKEEYRVLLNKMFEDEKIEEGAHAGVLPTAKEEVKEEVKEEPKTVEEIAKRYLESQLELMEMIRALYIRFNRFKEI